MLLLDAVIAAGLNVLLLAGIPFLGYFSWKRWRRKRSVSEIFADAGLQVGSARYLGYCAIVAIGVVAFLVL
jgi:hypothetical protein